MDLNLLFFSIHIALKNSSFYFLGSLAPSSIKKIHFIKKKQKWVAIIKKKWEWSIFFIEFIDFFPTCLPQVGHHHRNNLIVEIWKLHARKENSKSSREASQCRLNDKVRTQLRVTRDNWLHSRRRRQSPDILIMSCNLKKLASCFITSLAEIIWIANSKKHPYDLPRL